MHIYCKGFSEDLLQIIVDKFDVYFQISVFYSTVCVIFSLQINIVKGLKMMEMLFLSVLPSTILQRFHEIGFPLYEGTHIEI